MPVNRYHVHRKDKLNSLKGKMKNYEMHDLC